MKSSSSRYALLDELRGLDLISMMLYHGMWDAVYLFGVVVPWYSAGQGRLWQLGVHPSVWFLSAAGASSAQTRRGGLWCRSAGHSGDAAVHAGRCGLVWGADPAGLSHAPDGP